MESFGKRECNCACLCGMEIVLMREYPCLCSTHVSDPAQCPDRRSTELVLFAGHILGQTAGNNDHILRDIGHLLDAQINHAAEGHLDERKTRV